MSKSASSAPAGTSVHAHPPSHRGVRSGRAHVHAIVILAIKSKAGPIMFPFRGGDGPVEVTSGTMAAAGRCGSIQMSGGKSVD